MAELKHTKEKIATAVKACSSWAEVCKHLGLTPYNGNQTRVMQRAKQHGIDSSHFPGRRGKVPANKRPIQDYLTKGSWIGSAHLRLRLIKEGFKDYRCERCDRTEWLGLPIPLELDHINNDHSDNRLENLQVLCPNCHAQVTYQRQYEHASGSRSKLASKTG